MRIALRHRREATTPAHRSAYARPPVLPAPRAGFELLRFAIEAEATTPAHRSAYARPPVWPAPGAGFELSVKKKSQVFQY